MPSVFASFRQPPVQRRCVLLASSTEGSYLRYKCVLFSQCKGAIETKERALVDHDVLKLEVRRLRDILAMHADEVFSLENRKYQLKMSMEERKQEIEVHRLVCEGGGEADAENATDCLMLC